MMWILELPENAQMFFASDNEEAEDFAYVQPLTWTGEPDHLMAWECVMRNTSGGYSSTWHDTVEQAFNHAEKALYNWVST